jgi:hypothetical protein
MFIVNCFSLDMYYIDGVFCLDLYYRQIQLEYCLGRVNYKIKGEAVNNFIRSFTCSCNKIIKRRLNF